MERASATRHRPSRLGPRPGRAAAASASLRPDRRPGQCARAGRGRGRAWRPCGGRGGPPLRRGGRCARGLASDRRRAGRGRARARSRAACRAARRDRAGHRLPPGPAPGRPGLGGAARGASRAAVRAARPRRRVRARRARRVPLERGDERGARPRGGGGLGHGARQPLRRPRQAGGGRPGAHRRLPRPDRGGGRGRCQRRPAPGRRRPGGTGRARPAGRLPAGDRRARPLEGGRAGPGRGGHGRRAPGPGGARLRRPVRRGALRRPGRHAPGRRGVRARAPGAPGHRRRRRGRAGARRRRGVRRPVDAGRPRRLRGRHQPRPADRRHRPLRRRAVHLQLPAAGAGGRVRPGGAGRGGADGRRAVRGRGPARPRPRGRRAGAPMSLHGTTDRAARVRVRDDLAGLVPYGAPQLDVPVRLNTNETTYPVPPAVLDDMAEAVRGLGLERYPDREAARLREALARHAGHGLEGTWAANGSNEVLQQLLMAFAGPGRSALVVEPTYGMHSLIARATGTRVIARVQPRDRPVTADVAAGLVAEADADLTFWCSPNNPTGEASGRDTLAAICRAAPGLVVVDEAYGEFGRSRAADLLPRFPNLAVTRTFSKAFRVAGLRLGYLLADPSVVDGLRLVRLPSHLSSVTQAVALRALAHAGELMAHVAVIERERERVAAALARLPGVEVMPSDANFLCFATAVAPKRLWRGLVDRGVLVRDVSGYPTLDRHLRVSIGTPAENDAFLHALTAELA